jgi:hypothetical protein
MIHPPRTRLSATTTRRLGAGTAAWAVVFAAVHFYWAADGTIGQDPTGESLFDSLYIAFIALIALASGAIALGLSRPWGARLGRDRLRLLARLGGTLLSLGVIVGVAQWIAHASLGGDGASGVVITAYFALGGVLWSALGWLGDVSERRCRTAREHDRAAGVHAGA